MQSVKIMQVRLDILSRKDAVNEFFKLFDNNKQHFTATPNAEIILAAQANSELMEFLTDSSLNLADSVSLQWASRVKKYDWGFFRSLLDLILIPFKKAERGTDLISERVCGSDIFLDICERAAKEHKTIFLLGGLDDVPQKTKEFLLKQMPNLKVLDAISGSPHERDDESVRKLVNKSKPDILFLAYGCPAQELWIKRNLKHCPSVKVAMGIGGSFDFVSGKIKRAPFLFQKLGLEWLWRLILEPSRLKRIMRAVILFPYKIIVTGK